MPLAAVMVADLEPEVTLGTVQHPLGSARAPLTSGGSGRLVELKRDVLTILYRKKDCLGLC